MKRIVLITGSARKNGNSDLLAQAFIAGAQGVGHQVFRFDAAHKKLFPCIACDTCFTKGAACSRTDDFNELAPRIEEADTIVLCTPLYWFTFPGQIKMVIDKLYAFQSGKRSLNIQEAALLVCAETDDPKDFEGILTTFALLLRYKEWKNAGILTVPKVNKIGDIELSGGLEKAQELGRHI
ncbi:MAG: flavodoxin family protein [Spirochaetaceae bacterium]|jgi:multimeric flavodoxin WrbA|nr:flavodoxin family protein [Spirochaetaceae bacterium]